jgi:hypothetical protein
MLSKIELDYEVCDSEDCIIITWGQRHKTGIETVKMGAYNAFSWMYTIREGKVVPLLKECWEWRHSSAHS